MDLLTKLLETFGATLWDVAPIVVILLGFKFFVIRRRPPHLKRLCIGIGYVVVGLTFFLVGLEQALFPIGKTMAVQLTGPAFIADPATALWSDYAWVYVFAAAIGFSATVAEPALIAVGLKAEQISGGVIHSFGLRMAVAFGVAIGVSLGAFRIVSGTPLELYILVGYVLVILQTCWADRLIVPLAYDSGGVTTSTVTVPVVAALGLGLATSVEGRSALIDGFGLIAFASLFPMMTVMGYATLTAKLRRSKDKQGNVGEKTT